MFTSVSRALKIFPSFFSVRLFRQKIHGASSQSEAKGIEIRIMLEDVDGASLQEGSETCKHFLIGSEMENGRHSVFNFAMDSLNQALVD